MNLNHQRLGDAILAHSRFSTDYQGYSTGKIHRTFTLRDALTDWLYLRNGITDTHDDCARRAEEMLKNLVTHLERQDAIEKGRFSG